MAGSQGVGTQGGQHSLQSMLCGVAMFASLKALDARFFLLMPLCWCLFADASLLKLPCVFTLSHTQHVCEHTHTHTQTAQLACQCWQQVSCWICVRASWSSTSNHLAVSFVCQCLNIWLLHHACAGLRKSVPLQPSSNTMCSSPPLNLPIVLPRWGLRAFLTGCLLSVFLTCWAVFLSTARILHRHCAAAFMTVLAVQLRWPLGNLPVAPKSHCSTKDGRAPKPSILIISA